MRRIRLLATIHQQRPEGGAGGPSRKDMLMSGVEMESEANPRRILKLARPTATFGKLREPRLPEELEQIVQSGNPGLETIEDIASDVCRERKIGPRNIQKRC